MAREVRNIIKIDRDLCTGCGQCVLDCAEGAIAIVDGKAQVVSESYCDGLGACLSACPVNALTIEQRAAAPFDEEAAMAHAEQIRQTAASKSCPGSAVRDFSARAQDSSAASLFAQRFPMQGEPKAGGKPHACPGSAVRDFSGKTPSQQAAPAAGAQGAGGQTTRRLTWPVKLRLVPPSAPFLAGAHILLAADCAPAASASFHAMASGRVVLIACPKFEDNQEMLAKLTNLFAAAKPASITVLRMEVPCCRGLAAVCHEAAAAAGLGDCVLELTMGCDGQPKP